MLDYETLILAVMGEANPFSAFPWIAEKRRRAVPPFVIMSQGRIQGELQGLTATPQWRLAPLSRRSRSANFQLPSPNGSARSLFLHIMSEVIWAPSRQRKHPSATKRRPFDLRRCSSKAATVPSRQERRPSGTKRRLFVHDGALYIDTAPPGPAAPTQ